MGKQQTVSMPEARFFYAAKSNDLRTLQSFLARGVDVDSRAVVGGIGSIQPSYTHSREILEGDTALHIALRNRKREAARFLLDCGARRDMKSVQIAQDQGISDVFYTPATSKFVGYPVCLDSPSSLPVPVSMPFTSSVGDQGDADVDGVNQAYQGPAPPAAPVNPVNYEAPRREVPHEGIDIGVVCNGFDKHPNGDELRRYCVACMVEADRELEDEPLASLKIAEFLKTKFEDRYGLFWHCSVGNYKQEYYRDFCDLKRDHSFQIYASNWDATFVLWKSEFMDTSAQVHSRRVGQHGEGFI